MAVRAVPFGRVAPAVNSVPGAEISYVRNGQVWQAVKLDPVDFEESHRQALLTARLTPERELVFGAPGWKSVWIGAGEEKAVFLVIDPLNRAFALEVLAKGTYLAGRLTEGHYFADLHVPGLANVRWDSRAVCGHIFSGEVKAREFIYGDTLSGPGLKPEPAVKPSLLARLVGKCSRSWAYSVVYARYKQIRRTYKDAHEANVMFELLPLNNPEKKDHYLFPLLWLEEDGRLHLRFYRLTPIDVRIR